MNDLYDQRKILADGSIIQLLPYVPKRFNSGDVDDSLKSGSNDTLPDSFVIEGLEGKEARPFATELEKSLEMSSFQEGAY